MIDKKEKPQFASRTELKPVALTIEQLFDKTAELRNQANKKGKNSIHARKHSILEKLLTQITRKINSYDNDTLLNQSDEKELLKLNLVLFDILLTIFQLSQSEQTVLRTPRDNKRRNANYISTMEQWEQVH